MPAEPHTLLAAIEQKLSAYRMDYIHAVACFDFDDAKRLEELVNELMDEWSREYHRPTEPVA